MHRSATSAATFAAPRTSAIRCDHRAFDDRMTPYPGSYDRSPCAMPMAHGLCVVAVLKIITSSPVSLSAIRRRGAIWTSETGQAPL
jgi:hypothetical protein